MLSRMAENMYWFARYLERAENTARLVTVSTNLILDLPRVVTPDWEPLIDITSGRDAFVERYGEMSEHRVVQFLLADRENPSSLISCLTKARENLRTTRDIVPAEGWGQINRLHLIAQEQMGDALSRRGRHEFLQTIIGQCQMIVGLLDGVMSRDEAFEFMRLGRNLERADMTTRILDVRSGDLLAEMPADLKAYGRVQWMSVLKSLTAYQMYRRLVRSRVAGVDVVRFLLQEERFPRALQACLKPWRSACRVCRAMKPRCGRWPSCGAWSSAPTSAPWRMRRAPCTYTWMSCSSSWPVATMPLPPPISRRTGAECGDGCRCGDARAFLVPSSDATRWLKHPSTQAVPGGPLSCPMAAGTINPPSALEDVRDRRSLSSHPLAPYAPGPILAPLDARTGADRGRSDLAGICVGRGGSPRGSGIHAGRGADEPGRAAGRTRGAGPARAAGGGAVSGGAPGAQIAAGRGSP